jgi:hypothetical protein
MKIPFLIFIMLFQLIIASVAWAEARPAEPPTRLPVSALLGEKLTYNVSFLWFKKIARGEISLEAGERKGTYLATLKAKTRGMAAFFTRNRVETYMTLMEEGPDGLLRPLLQTADTKKDKDGLETHRQTSYAFDFPARQVTYHKTINGVAKQKLQMDMDEEAPAYDFLSAFYNLRLGRLGSVDPGRDVKLAAFSRKGPKEIVIHRLLDEESQRLNFSDDLMLCKVLLDPDTFKTKGRDVYVGFDDLLRPQFAVIKNVIGLGDVRGELVRITKHAQPY